MKYYNQLGVDKLMKEESRSSGEELRDETGGEADSSFYTRMIAGACQSTIGSSRCNNEEMIAGGGSNRRNNLDVKIDRARECNSSGVDSMYGRVNECSLEEAVVNMQGHENAKHGRVPNSTRQSNGLNGSRDGVGNSRLACGRGTRDKLESCPCIEDGRCNLNAGDFDTGNSGGTGVYRGDSKIMAVDGYDNMVDADRGKDSYDVTVEEMCNSKLVLHERLDGSVAGSNTCGTWIANELEYDCSLAVLYNQPDGSGDVEVHTVDMNLVVSIPIVLLILVWVVKVKLGSLNQYGTTNSGEYWEVGKCEILEHGRVSESAASVCSTISHSTVLGSLGQFLLWRDLVAVLTSRREKAELSELSRL